MLIREMDVQRLRRSHTNCGCSMRIGQMISQLSLYRLKTCLMNDDDDDDGMIQTPICPLCFFCVSMSEIHHI